MDKDHLLKIINTFKKKAFLQIISLNYLIANNLKSFKCYYIVIIQIEEVFEC